MLHAGRRRLDGTGGWRPSRAPTVGDSPYMTFSAVAAVRKMTAVETSARSAGAVLPRARGKATGRQVRWQQPAAGPRRRKPASAVVPPKATPTGPGPRRQQPARAGPRARRRRRGWRPSRHPRQQEGGRCGGGGEQQPPPGPGQQETSAAAPSRGMATGSGPLSRANSKPVHGPPPVAACPCRRGGGLVNSSGREGTQGQRQVPTPVCGPASSQEERPA